MATCEDIATLIPDELDVHGAITPQSWLWSIVTVHFYREAAASFHGYQLGST